MSPVKVLCAGSLSHGWATAQSKRSITEWLPCKRAEPAESRLDLKQTKRMRVDAAAGEPILKTGERNRQYSGSTR